MLQTDVGTQHRLLVGVNATHIQELQNHLIAPGDEMALGAGILGFMQAFQFRLLFSHQRE